MFNYIYIDIDYLNKTKNKKNIFIEKVALKTVFFLLLLLVVFIFTLKINHLN
jgi:hypothetical protein